MSVDTSATATEKLTTDLIDNVASHPTPEGLMLTLMPAGMQPRLSAWLIDFAIRIGVIIILSTIAKFISVFLGEVGFGMMAIGFFLIYWLYPVYFEVYRDGMTPGKKSQGIYVCHDDGTPIRLQASMIRNLLRVADFLPFGFAGGAVVMMFNRRSQRIGDVVAGTLVVYRQQDDVHNLYKSVYGMAAKPHSALQQSLASQQVSAATNTHVNAQGLSNAATVDMSAALFFYPLSLTEQQALVSFAERVPFLSQPRQQEIATALAPMIKTQVQTPYDRGEAIRQAVIYRAAIIQGQGQPQRHSQPQLTPYNRQYKQHGEAL